MARRAAAVATVWAAVMLAVSPASAAGEVIVDDVDLSAHPEVALTVSLPPELAGRALPADAFAVSEGETSVAPGVERLANEDLEVVLVLDTSQSMRGAPLAAAIDAASSFAASMPDEVRIAVVTFATSPTVVVDFGPPVDVAAALGSVAASGETALYDGIVTAAGLWDGASPSRRALVLLSDGGDTVSEAALEDVIVELLGSGAQFYAVELQSPESDPEALVRLEAATGGTLVGADEPGAITSIFDEIAGTLTSRYLLTYVSTSEGPTEIAVEVSFGGVTSAGSARVQLPVRPPFSPEGLRRAPLTPTSDPIPQVPTTRVAEPGLLASQNIALAGGALFFAGLWGLIRTAQSPSDKRPKTLRRPRWRAPSAGEKALSSFADRASSFAERQLERASQSKGLAMALEQAGSALRPGEYLVMSGSFAIFAAAIGLLVGDWWVAGGFALGVLGLSAAVLRQRGRRRQARFGDQLGDALLLIAGGLQAGHGIIQACGAVASEEMEPASEEFRRLIAETRLGRDFTEALRAMGERVGGDDFQWVVDAIDIHREVGGNLSEVLRSVASTIRSRNQVRRRVQALSAEGRLSGIVLMALPFVVGGLVTATNPEYLAELFAPGPGRLMLAGGVVLMAIGGVWIHKVVSLRF